MNRIMILPILLLAIGCEVVEPGTPPVGPPTPTVAEGNKKTDHPSPEVVSPKEKEDKVARSEEEWRKILSPEEYRVLREKGTERAFTGEYDKHFEPGAYACAACESVLFESDTKFNSGCGWPAFYAAKAGNRVTQTTDYSLGMVRTEVTCSRCDSHLGHIFDDAPGTPTGQRYCINSVSLKFIPKKELDEQVDKEKNIVSDADAAKPKIAEDADTS